MQEFTADLLFGPRFGVNVWESFAFRVSAGKGVFILPGAYVGLSSGFALFNDEFSDFVDVVGGLQFKVPLNRNVNK